VGRPKGKATKPNKYWTKEEKLRIVKKVINHEESLSIISQQENINPGQLHLWVKKYLETGEQSLLNRNKPGCPYNGLHLKKNLTDIEQLQLENMKLRVENERLKKGYIVRGDGPNKEYISLLNKNMK